MTAHCSEFSDRDSWVAKWWRRRLPALVAAAAFGVALAGSAQAGTLTPIASYAGPGGGSTSVLDINNSGWMTGSIGFSGGSGLGFSRDAAGVYSTFSVDYFTQGRAIDNANNISGYATDASGSPQTDHEFVRTPGGAVTLLQNPGDATYLRGIAQGMNASGTIVGDYYSGPGATNPRHGYVLGGGVLTDLSVPGFPADRLAARGIADDGTVAGWASIGGTIEGFILSGGVYSFISDPNAVNGTYFEDLNNNGLISGEWGDAGGNFHAFLYNSVSHVFTEINVAGATNAQAFGLNDAGLAVITTDIATGPNNFIFNALGVPEPQVWALMLMGFLGTGLALRLRASAAA
jgi:hypothetical protein